MVLLLQLDRKVQNQKWELPQITNIAQSDQAGHVLSKTTLL